MYTQRAQLQKNRVRRNSDHSQGGNGLILRQAAGRRRDRATRCYYCWALLRLILLEAHLCMASVKTRPP